MNNLKNIILDSIQNNNSLDNAFYRLSTIQENLLKNYSNPIFNNKDKNEILKNYTNLQNIGETLFRYKSLKENNFINKANEEKSNIEKTFLNGGISYNKYIWRSENSANTCELCKSLDGKIFESYEEVPARPHPNCQCRVEVLEYDYDKLKNQPQNANEIACDLNKTANELIKKLKNAKNETIMYVKKIKSDIFELENNLKKVETKINIITHKINLLKSEYKKHVFTCKNNIDINYEYLQNQKITLEMIWMDIQNLLELGFGGIATFGIFIMNYIELLYRAYILKEYEMDKYYHSKANCEAVQWLGEVGEQAAIILSNAKEKFDQWENVYAKTHKISIEEAIADSERDQVANSLGRERGKKYPDCKCYELMQDLKPKN